MFHGSFKEVLRVFQGSEGCSESPLRVTQGSFKVSERSSKGVSRQFQRFKGVKESVKRVSRKFHKKFCNFVVASMSSQLPEQKEGLLFVLFSLFIILVCACELLFFSFYCLNFITV